MSGRTDGRARETAGAPTARRASTGCAARAGRARARVRGDRRDAAAATRSEPAAPPDRPRAPLLGFVGFFVKLIHIPINNILMT